MEVLLQVFCTLISSVAIVYSKDLNFRPLFFWHFRFFLFRLDNIQNNGNSVFICFSYQANMRICCKGFNNSEFFICCFWILKHWESWAGSDLHVVFLGLIKFNSRVVLWRCWWWFYDALVTSWRLACVMIRWYFRIPFSACMWFGIRDWSSSLCNWVHVASLRLVDSFVWRLLSQRLLTQWFLLMSTLSWARSFSIIWVHSLLVIASDIQFDVIRLLIDASRMRCLLHHGVSASHLWSAIWDLSIWWRCWSWVFAHWCHVLLWSIVGANTWDVVWGCIQAVWILARCGSC